ncbi:alpha/beta fold hydrolase [Streptomyces sp. NPDC051985]|uniref:alpha/beta fold hydrolase n=1 Tax=Streptomyces sp. NPDC051985 TaxID=3155807 RepID=UPI00342541FE
MTIDAAEPGSSASAVEEHLEYPGGRVHLFRGGEGAPVLFLHAAGGAGRWYEFHEALAGRFQVIAPDHPGFGGSDTLDDVEGVDDLVFHYVDLIERLGLERPHVVGASFGGWVAAELAVARPDLIGSLVLLSPAGLRLPEHPVEDLFLMTPDQVVTALFNDPAKASVLFSGEPDIDDILAAYRDMTAFARYSWAPFLSNPKLERRLHRVTAPTLVACPAEDRVIPVAHGRRYAERIPGAEFSLIDDCGHAMYFERPAAFADAVTEFLTTNTAVEPSGVSR